MMKKLLLILAVLLAAGLLTCGALAETKEENTPSMGMFIWLFNFRS